jgi:hypothetical protein
MVVVVALAIGMAVVASAASVSLSPTTRTLAATNENPLVGRELSATDLGTLRGRLSTANAINDLGQDVGIATRLGILACLLVAKRQDEEPRNPGRA